VTSTGGKAPPRPAKPGRVRREPPPRTGWTKLDNELVSRGAWAELKDLEARVYIVLLTHMNERRECWPGLRRLAMLSRTGAHPVSVSNAVQALQRHGLIEIRPAGGSSNVYTGRTWQQVARARQEAETLSVDIKPTLNAHANTPLTSTLSSPLTSTLSKVDIKEVDPKEVEATAKAAAAPRRLSSASTSGRGKDRQPVPAVAPIPPGFEQWLVHLNRGLGLQSPRGYTVTSATGKRLATQFARVHAENRWTEPDLLKAIDVAAAKAATGFRLAATPRWMLANLEELILEAKPRPGNGRAASSVSVFRRGAEYDEMVASMKSVVER